MKRFADAMALLAITLWVGGLWGIGYIAAPVLFQTLPDKMLAGMLAGKMFTVIAYIGIASASYLITFHLKSSGRAALCQIEFRIVIVMLILALIGQFGIQPIMIDLKQQALPDDVMHSALAGRFKILHGISSILYLMQSLLGGWLVVKSRYC